jgi:hypothetical protein
MIFAGLCAAAVEAHPHAPIAVRINPEDSSEVQLFDYATKQTRAVFRSQKGAVYEVLVSPYFSRIAVVETTAATAGEDRYTQLPVNSLVVIDADGNVLRSVDRDVRRVVFSPDGESLGFLTGSYYDGGIGFKPGGAFTLDVESGEVEAIPDVDLPYEIEWARDGGIYLKVLALEGGPAVWRYDVRSQTLTESPGGAFHLSPDGAFSLQLAYETVESGECEPQRGVDSCLRVVDRRTNQAVEFFSRDVPGEVDGWVNGEGHQIMFSQRLFEAAGDGSSPFGLSSTKNYVYDAATTSLVESFSCERARGLSEGHWVTSPRAIHCRDEKGVRYVRGGTTAAPPPRRPAPPPRRPAPPRPVPQPAPELRPTAIQPAADSQWAFSNPLFLWQGLDGADNYSLQVLSEPDRGPVIEREGLREGRWRSEPLAVGTYSWTVTAFTGSTPIGAPMLPVHFVILSAEADLEPPVTAVGLLGPQIRAGGELVSTDSAKLEVDVEDSPAGVEHTRIAINGREIALGEAEQPWPGGQNLVEIEVADRAGNTATMEPFRFLVDTVPPEIAWRFVPAGDLPRDDGRDRGRGSMRSATSAPGVRRLEVSDDSGLGRPLIWGKGLEPRIGERSSRVKSDTPQIFISSPAEWAFADSVDAREGDVLWVNAVDLDSRIVDSMSVRVREEGTGQTGSVFVLEITASDIFGNASSILFPLRGD